LRHLNVLRPPIWYADIDLNREADVNSDQILPESTISDLFARWPATILIFMHHRMSCVGCCMARFDTLQDAMVNYRLDPAQFVTELESAIAGETTGIAG
jgi:hybrid cluster-associated redox disulfide protein